MPQTQPQPSPYDASAVESVPAPPTPAHLPPPKPAEVLAPFEQQEQTYEEYIEELDLGRYVLILKRRWWVMAVCGVLLMVPATLFALWQQRLPRTYTAYGKLLVQRQDTQALLTGVGQEVGELQTISREPFNTEIALLRSSSVIEAAIKELNWRDPLTQELIDTSVFNRNLEIGQLEDTDILNIAYTSSKPEEAQEIVDTLMDVYIRRNTELNRAEVVAAREFIEGQLPDLEKQVRDVTQALQEFKQQNNIVSLESESGMLTDRLTTLTQQIEDLQTQLATAEASSQALRSQLNMDAQKALALTAAIEDPGIQEVLGNLQTTQTNLAVQQTLYTPEHPTVANLARQVNALETLLQERLDEVLQDSGQTLEVNDLHLGSVEQDFAGELVQAEITRASLSQQIQQLRTLQDQYARRIEQIPALEVQQQRLQDQVDLAQANYQRLRNRLPELVIAESQSVGISRVEIIERAVVPPSTEPGFNVLYVIIGGVAGGFGGLGLVIFLELIDRSVKTIRDAEAITGHLALGAISEFTTSAERNVGALVNDELSPRLVVLRSPESPICESYQMISAALRLRGFGDRLTSLALVSAIGEEGRSEILANLAATLAQGRRRVVVVDADLRAPSQHLLWKVPNEQGLGDILEQNTPLNPETLGPFIQTLNPYLDLLPSGKLPINPLALLDSQFMMDLVTFLSDRYDWVLIDTPPLTRAADAALIGQMVDGAVWVVRTQFVDPSLIVVARALLLKSRTPVVGIVANQVDFRVEAAAYAHFNRQHREAKSSLLEGLLGGGRSGQLSKEEMLLVNLGATSTPASPEGAAAEAGAIGAGDWSRASQIRPGRAAAGLAYAEGTGLPTSQNGVPQPVPPGPEATEPGSASDAAQGTPPIAPPQRDFADPVPGVPSEGEALVQTAQLLHSAAARRARAREVASRRAARAAGQQGEESRPLQKPEPDRSPGVETDRPEPKGGAEAEAIAARAIDPNDPSHQEPAASPNHSPPNPPRDPQPNSPTSPQTPPTPSPAPAGPTGESIEANGWSHRSAQATSPSVPDPTPVPEDQEPKFTGGTPPPWPDPWGDNGASSQAEVTPDPLALEPELLESLGILKAEPGQIVPRPRSSRPSWFQSWQRSLGHLKTWGRTVLGTYQTLVRQCQGWLARLWSRWK